MFTFYYFRAFDFEGEQKTQDDLLQWLKYFDKIINNHLGLSSSQLTHSLCQKQINIRPKKNLNLTNK